jgi:hypothetical protein
MKYVKLGNLLMEIAHHIEEPGVGGGSKSAHGKGI